MSTRIYSALISALMLAACGEAKTDHATLARYEAQLKDPADDLAECAHGQEALARACAIERQTGNEGLILTLRHPDGAFHRLRVTKDGRGVIAADGAEPAVVSVVRDGRIEVALGGDRYRLPVTIKARK